MREDYALVVKLWKWFFNESEKGTNFLKNKKYNGKEEALNNIGGKLISVGLRNRLISGLLELVLRFFVIYR